MSQQSIHLRTALAMTIRRFKQSSSDDGISPSMAAEIYHKGLGIFSKELVRRPEAEWDNQWAHELLTDLHRLIKERSPEIQLEEIQPLHEEKQFAILKSIALTIAEDP